MTIQVHCPKCSRDTHVPSDCGSHFLCRDCGTLLWKVDPNTGVKWRATAKESSKHENAVPEAAPPQHTVTQPPPAATSSGAGWLAVILLVIFIASPIVIVLMGLMELSCYPDADRCDNGRARAIAKSATEQAARDSSTFDQKQPEQVSLPARTQPPICPDPPKANGESPQKDTRSPRKSETPDVSTDKEVPQSVNIPKSHSPGARVRRPSAAKTPKATIAPSSTMEANLKYYAKRQRVRKTGEHGNNDEATHFNSASADAHIDRGIRSCRKGNLDEAISEFNRAIRLDPTCAKAYHNRGVAWILKGDYDQAIADFDAAIGLNPAYAVAYRNRGLAFERKGEKEKAEKDYKMSRQLDHND